MLTGESGTERAVFRTIAGMGAVDEGTEITGRPMPLREPRGAVTPQLSAGGGGELRVLYGLGGQAGQGNARRIAPCLFPTSNSSNYSLAPRALHCPRGCLTN